MEKYNFSFGTAGKGLQYLSPLLSKGTLQRPTHRDSLEKSEPKIELSISSKLGGFFVTRKNDTDHERRENLK